MPRFRVSKITGLILLAALAAGCQRTATPGPSPVGPSTFALTFTLVADPNIIMAGTARPTSVIRAVVTENGEAAFNRTVFFTITAGPGEFPNFSQRAAVTTDWNGIASVTYTGPTKFEIEADTTATIMGQLETSSPQIIAKTVTVTILFSE
ncbi:MAG: hypothetical protein NTW38_05800 [Candidatus Aminicenantes bacterium]|nr:hypothetical protein [Candidatus Aminicenantes bacterium]